LNPDASGGNEKEIRMNYNENLSGNQTRELFPTLWNTGEELNRAVSACLARVFVRMFAALLVTAGAALAVATFDTLQALVFRSIYTVYGLIILELVLVVAISARINTLSNTTANVMFFLYALLNGLTLSVIFFVYELGTIYNAFAVSALMFAAMAIYGTITRRDLTSIGSMCMMGLFGIIIASVVNIFLRNNMLDAIICYIGVVVFIGLTAYDTQRIKRMLEGANATSHTEAIQKISVMGALALYLDFINLFLKILRIFGRRRN